MASRAIKWIGNGAVWALICCAVAVTFVASAQRRRSAPASKPRVDYASFSHHTEQHHAACSSCHKFPSKNWKEVRKGDDAFPDVTEFPEHESCLGCHRQQFFARERPAPRICSNCHVKAAPNNTTRWPFPSLREAFLATARGRDFRSDFKVVFPHEKHEDASCDDCHEMQEKEVVKTKLLTHANCFVCHNQESELPPLGSNCDSCHKPPTAETNVPKPKPAI